MKRIIFILTLLFSICASAQIERIISTPPNPPRLVNDFTGTLTTAQLEALERKLYQYDDTTSNQIVVVMVGTTGKYSVEDAALSILRNWGVGGKDKNNGIVILVAKDDHKVRIETGYGMEGVVSDLMADAIIENDLLPQFRDDNYYRGIDLAVNDIIKAAEGRYTAPEGYRSKKSKGPGFGLILFILIMVLLFSGLGGRGGGGMASRRGYRDFGTGWLIGTLLSGGRGGWSGGGGGGWSGGGGGGFGGFGGGSGGGGGASGSW